MPKRTDINKILIIGAGPIVIGQACEFDYSGVQACKSLKDEGYKIILINSNPATIMTDPNFADKTYIEPITVEFLEKIIEIEKPDVLLPTMGGQTALNLAIECDNAGVWKKHKIKMIGVNVEAINTTEDRELFRLKMKELDINVCRGEIAKSFLRGKEIAQDIGFPLVIRPSFTLGGSGGGLSLIHI